MWTCSITFASLHKNSNPPPIHTFLKDKNQVLPISVFPTLNTVPDT